MVNIMEPQYADMIVRLRARVAQIAEWLQKEGVQYLTEQRHLDPDTPERIYWHLGYLAALNDVLRQLAQPNADTV
jgi:hypothetical protein